MFVTLLPALSGHVHNMNKYAKKVLPLDSQVRGITIALTAYSFAISLASVFLPLIMLQNGASLRLISFYFVTYAVIKLCINYGAMLVIQKFGASLGLLISFIAGASQLGFIAAYTSNPSSIYLVISAAALAVANAFSWNSQHLYLSRTLNATSKSSNLASIEILGKILTVAGPILGAFIGTQFGSSWVLATATLIIVLTIWPLRHMRKYEKQNPLKPYKLDYSLAGAPRRDLIANFSFNIETAVGSMLWPVYLAVVLTSFKAVGLITSFGTLASILAVKIAGHRGDKGKNRSVLNQGANASALAHLLRLLVTTPLAIGLVGAFYQASLGYMKNAWTSLYYHHTSKGGINYIISMEIACDLAYVFLWTLFFVLTFVSTNVAFNGLFIVAAIAAFGSRLVSKDT